MLYTKLHKKRESMKIMTRSKAQKMKSKSHNQSEKGMLCGLPRKILLHIMLLTHKMLF